MKRPIFTALFLALAFSARAGMIDVALIGDSETAVFYVQTSQFSTGVAFDATGSPGYRIYEMETGTPILTGSLALLDDAGTIGFYSEEITTSAGNGFEDGKSYCIRVTATVDGVAAANAFVFRATTKRISGLNDFDQAAETVDVGAISGDSAAAVNLESQYDGTTGLTGDTFPANQSQINQIANVAGISHRTASSYVLTLGTQSANTVSETKELDGVRHEHTDDSGEMDLYYEFDIGSSSASGVLITGYLQGNNDDLEVYAFEWSVSDWRQIGTLNGQASATDVVNDFTFFDDMVGSGANEGLVRVRFFDGAFTLTGATLAIDQILVEFAQGVEGYQNGAIWLDTVNITNTNTVRGVDGTATNPVSTIAAVNTLLASTNLSRVEVAPQSSFTLAVSQDNQRFSGRNWTMALGGQSISGSFIEGANITGIGTGASEIHFDHCHFGIVTIPPSDLEDCVLENTITIGSEGDFFFENCKSGIAGTGTPVLDFGAARNASSVNFRSYSGGIQIENMGAGAGTYDMSLEGWGQLVIAANCSAGNLAIRGLFTITDNASEAITLSDVARFDSVQLIDDNWNEVITAAAHNVVNSAARTLRELKEQIVYMGVIWINTSGGGTSGAEEGENGTIENPVDNITDALTLSGLTGITRMRVSSGSSITLVAALEGVEIFNSNWDLYLGGQSISGSCVIGANVSGIASGTVSPKFQGCHITTSTLPPCHVLNSSIGGIITAGSAGDFFFEDCKSAIAGTDTPTFDFGSGLDASNVGFRMYSGGIRIENMGSGSGNYSMTLEGFGQLVIAASCSASSVIVVRGLFTVSDFAGGAVTLSDDARYDIDQVNAQADLALTNYDGPTNAEMIARTLLAASYFDAAVDVVARVTLVDTTTTNTDMLTAAAVVIAFFAHTPTALGIATIQDMFNVSYAVDRGKMTISGDYTAQTVSVFDDDDSTSLTKFTTTPTGRTPD